MTWSIQRIDAQPPGTVELVCESGEEARKVTLYNDATGETEAVILCSLIEDPDPCGMLALLQVSYPDNDWTVRCGFEAPLAANEEGNETSTDEATGTDTITPAA